MWDAAAAGSYNNDIAGIGRDDGSALNQKQSKSINANSIVTMGLGSIAADNVSNANAFGSDLQFLAWGNDGGGTTLTSTGTPAGHSRLERIWRAAETGGDVGNVELMMDVLSLTGTPAADLVLLFDSTDTDFSDATQLPATAYSPGVVTFASVNLADGDHFTLSVLDADADGVSDTNDTCAGTTSGLAVNATGCPTPANIVGVSNDPADGGFDETDLTAAGLTTINPALLAEYEVGFTDPTALNLLPYADPLNPTLAELQAVIDAVNAANTDEDGDMVLTGVDLDDDNDGIPDVVECGIDVGGVFLSISNGGFETPLVTPGGNLITLEDNVPGWETTATDDQIELLSSGFLGVPAYEGAQFAEINALQAATLFHDIATTPGDKINWSFAHRGRSGTDIIELFIGAPGSLVSQGTFSTPNTTWQVYSGTYTVPAGQTTTRFQYQAIGGGSDGNFLDAISFVSTVCHGDTDGDGMVSSLDLDSDNDGIYDVVEAGGADTDNDGRLDNFNDADGDGLHDDVDDVDSGSGGSEVTSGTPLAYANSDTDILPDALDLDSEGDGIPDNIEAQLIASYTQPDGAVAANGVDTAYPNGLTPVNSDFADTPNYQDTDSNNNGTPDEAESGLPALAGSDSDGDGLDDNVDIAADRGRPMPGSPIQPPSFPMPTPMA